MYDKIFKPNATQEKVYSEAAKAIVKGKIISILIATFIVTWVV